MRINKFSILMFLFAITLTGIPGSEAFGQTVDKSNLAFNKAARLSATNEWSGQKGEAKNAVDGNLLGGIGNISETPHANQNSYFEVDLGDYYKIDKIRIHPRTDCCVEMFQETSVIVTDQAMGDAPIVSDAKIKKSANYFESYKPLFVKNDTKAKDVFPKGAVGRYVRLQLKGFGAIELSEIEVFGTKAANYTPNPDKAWLAGAGAPNLALNKPAKLSATNEWSGQKGEAKNAVDGNLLGGIGNISETPHANQNSYFEVDLGDYYKIDKIVINPRTDCCVDMFQSTYVIVTDQAIGNDPIVNAARIARSSTFTKLYEPIFKATDKEAREVSPDGAVGRYVRLQLKGFGAIELSEIEVFGTKAEGYKPNPESAWTAPFKAPFDPNYPDYGNASEALMYSIKNMPKIIGFKNPNGSFDVAYQGVDNLIKVNTYEKAGTGFQKNPSKYLQVTDLGLFGGFTKDANGKRYIFTGERWNESEDEKKAIVYQDGAELWNAKFYDVFVTKKELQPQGLMEGGTTRLVTAGDSLLITTNLFPTHPYQVVLDTKTKANNNNRLLFESLNQHNFGQRAIFDGTDYVVMENRDHDVSVTMTKIKPTDVFPLGGDKNGHTLPYTDRIFSVYSHTNFINDTYTELGNVEKGLNDTDGYLVLFASERDWDWKMNEYRGEGQTLPLNRAPKILSPRDIGLVHVRKNFDTVTKTVNWLNGSGNKSMCPKLVDNSAYVNSNGTQKTVTYNSANDGWNWDDYNCPKPKITCVCRDEIRAGLTTRQLTTSGVNWLTQLGVPNENSKAKASGEFTTVNHPKLVRIATNKYIVLWEEWTAKLGDPKVSYVTTRAASLKLEKNVNGNVDIKVVLTKDLGVKYRLMPGDDAFEFDGKAAWAVGDMPKNKITFFTVDEFLNSVSFDLEP